jgi:hypothetical protein
MARRDKVQDGKGDTGEDRQGKDGDCGKHGMRI